MTLQQLLLQTRRKLESEGVDEAPLQAELLLMKATGMARPALYAWPEKAVTADEHRTLEEDLARRLTGEPWPYITGCREFYGLEMAVSEGIFIPRPETELLVEMALRVARNLRGSGPLVIADVGAGSGAVAVALAVHLPQATVYATDPSSHAVETATLNCKRHGVDDRVKVLRGSLLTPLPVPVDMVVSNPPYIPSHQVQSLPIEVRREPVAALDGGPDGLDVVRDLLRAIPKSLRRPGAFLMELGSTQGPATHALAEHLLPGATVSIHRDLAGLDRVLLAEVA